MNTLYDVIIWCNINNKSIRFEHYFNETHVRVDALLLKTRNHHGFWTGIEDTLHPNSFTSTKKNEKGLVDILNQWFKQKNFIK